MGVVERHELGRLAGNSSSQEYDYVIIFRNRSGDAFRAIADIESHAAVVGDQVWGIGALEGFVIASIETDGDRRDLFSKYARASDQTSICNVYSMRAWSISDRVNNIFFDESARISSLCD